MPTNDGRHERDGEVQRWTATAGQHDFRAPHWASRLFRAHRRTTDNSGPEVITSDVPQPVRQQVLREYHTATLAQARHASEALVRAGFNIGGVPYGYRAQRVRLAQAGTRARWRTRLIIEPVEAATVKMIFTWRGEDGLTIAAIRQRLLAARYPAPLDPDTGQPGACTYSIIRAILRNPKYMGRQVWGRSRHGRRVPGSSWVWSPAWTHSPIVTPDEFTVAQRRSSVGRPTTNGDTSASADQAAT